jgi:hypothetical protein
VGVTGGGAAAGAIGAGAAAGGGGIEIARPAATIGGETGRRAQSGRTSVLCRRRKRAHARRTGSPSDPNAVRATGSAEHIDSKCLSWVKNAGSTQSVTSALTLRSPPNRRTTAIGEGQEWTGQLVTVTYPGLFGYGLILHRFMRKVQIDKNPAVASAMTDVASHPITSIGRERVSRPIMRGFIAITIMTAINGAASTPLTTALQ